ncbi:MAG: hypothetical protein ACPIOQ_82275, partial [Promethearchaeia archaeon]
MFSCCALAARHGQFVSGAARAQTSSDEAYFRYQRLPRALTVACRESQRSLSQFGSSLFGAVSRMGCRTFYGGRLSRHGTFSEYFSLLDVPNLLVINPRGGSFCIRA